MKLEIFSIKDRVTSQFGGIDLAVNSYDMMRKLAPVVNKADKQHPFAQNPGDYELYDIGSFDQEVGAVNSKLEFVCNLNDLVNASNKE